MNNEILEISQWLYEKGFAPDQWTGTEGHIFFTNGPGTLLIYKALEEDGEELEGTVSDNYTPYFTLNRALELLPESIEIKNYCTIEPSPENIEPYPDKESDRIIGGLYIVKKDWERFQKQINKGSYEDVYFILTLRKYYIAYERYSKYDGGHEGDLFKEEGDLHLSTLRLLKKTVEEGYVKAN